MFSIFKRKKKDQERLADQVALGANVENLSLHSDAGREFVKAYTGSDGELGRELQKSLRGITSGKPNMVGQRGYAAEVEDVARRNAEEILKRSDVRYSRVDDLPGHAVNETPFDIMAVDANGREIASLGSQMKFNQGNPADVVDTLLGKSFREKYPHAQYSVPSDRYDAIKQAMTDKICSLENQYERAKQSGNRELMKTLKERLDYAKKAKDNLVPSKVSLSEAEYAVVHPMATTAKDMLKVGHDAGVQYAKSAAAIKGAVAFATCLDKVIEGEMSPEQAAKEIASQAAKGAVAGYTTGQANSALGAIMKNSSSEAIRKMGAGCAPAQVIVFVTNVFRIVNDRMEGKITDEECFHQVAKSGVGVIGTFQAGKYGAIVGKGLGKKIGGKIGGTVGAVGGPVCAIIGSIVAGIVIDAAYDYSVAQLKAPGIAKKERIQIEKECKQLHSQLEQYRENFRSTYVAHTEELVDVFGDSLRGMAQALQMNDADSFISGASTITKALGGTTQFDSVKEFEDFLNSDSPLIL